MGPLSDAGVSTSPFSHLDDGDLHDGTSRSFGLMTRVCNVCRVA